MAPRATGQLIPPMGRQRSWAIRFRAYGRRRQVTLGRPEEGWNRERAEAELRHVLADVERGIWRAAEPTLIAGSTESPTFHEFASERLDDRRSELRPLTIADRLAQRLPRDRNALRRAREDRRRQLPRGGHAGRADRGTERVEDLAQGSGSGAPAAHHAGGTGGSGVHLPRLPEGREARRAALWRLATFDRALHWAATGSGAAERVRRPSSLLARTH